MSIPIPIPREQLGTVVFFDDERGIGTVRNAEGVETFFHCTAIADDTRSIAVGARVTYTVVPGHLGGWEAAEIKER